MICCKKCGIVYIVKKHLYLGGGHKLDADMLLVKADVLPEVFEKVVMAKQLLNCKKAKSATEASKMCGISRSAFYKYRDSVFSYKEMFNGNIINLSAVLEDKAGVLSLFISVLHEMNANILTINQGMPSGGVAQVTVSYRCEKNDNNIAKVLERLSQIDGIITIEQVLGGV